MNFALDLMTRGKSLKHVDPKSRYGRIAGLVDVDALAAKRLTIIGLGSMGQPISSQMARHGVATRSPGRLRLIDGDTVTPRNLIGTEYRLEHLDVPKVQASANIVGEINGEVNVSYWNRMISRGDIPAIIDMAKQSDLLTLCADSFELMLEISSRCEDICPQVMAVFGPNVEHAEVAFSVPEVTQPIPKTMGKRKRQAIAEPRGLGCDTAYVSSFVTAVCLRLLLGTTADEQMIPCYANAPLFVLGLRRSWIFANQAEDIARSIVCVHLETPKKE